MTLKQPFSFLAAVFAMTLAVAPAVPPTAASATTLAVAPNPATLGQAMTLTATVSPATAAGKVTFYDGAMVVGISTLSGGQATLTTNALPSGSGSLRAYYSGNGSVAASSSMAVARTVFALPQNGFRVTSAFDAGTAMPVAVVIADFNGDGVPDLATLSGVNTSAGSVISIQLGKAGGTFQAAVNYDAGSFPCPYAGCFLTVGDFNGDGKPDLVLANKGNVGMLQNKGDGTFQAMVIVATNPGPLAVADFNGDGRPDIVVAAGSTVSVLLGNGDGTFQPALNSNGIAAINVVVADFNGDGAPDIALGINSNIAVLLGKGDGTFGPPSMPASLKGGESIVVGDFNGDGKPDLAQVGPLYANLSVILGNGDGTFSAPLYNSLAVGSTSSGAVVAGDFNGDGQTDLAINSGGGLSVMTGNGNGTFHNPVNYKYTAGCGGFRGAGTIAVGDLNGDGVSDLVAALEEGCGSVNLFTGVATAVAPQPVFSSVVTAASYQLVVAEGMIASLFGANLSATNMNATSAPIPTELGGVSLSVNGVLAPLFYVSPVQINFQVPWEALGQIRPVIVTVNGSPSVAQPINVWSVSPGIFSLDASGSGQGAIQIANTATFATQARPAHRGEFLTIYCSGLGDVAPRPATGAPASGDTLSNTLLMPSVTIGGVSAFVTFSGLSPGFTGLYQVNIQVPDAAPTGGRVPVILSIGGLNSNAVTIAVQ